jgi:glycosyltransferase involved in cell wall biosynthesis
MKNNKLFSFGINTSKPLKPYNFGEVIDFINGNWKYSNDSLIKKYKRTLHYCIYHYYLHFLCLLYMKEKTEITPISKRDGKVSVCVPCYNQSEYIQKTIQSASEQTVPPTEIIVLLMDKDSQSLKEQLETNKLVKCYNCEQLTVNIARRKLAELATTNWLIFLDGDDLLPENFIETFLSEKTDADAYFCNYFIDFFGNENNINFVGDEVNLTGFISRKAFLEMTADDEYGSLEYAGDDFKILKDFYKFYRTKFVIGAFYYHRRHNKNISFNPLDREKLFHIYHKDLDLVKEAINTNVKYDGHGYYLRNMAKKYFRTKNIILLYKKLDLNMNFKYFVNSNNELLFNQLLLSRKRTPITNTFSPEDYEFINYKRDDNILKEISDFSFDVIFFKKPNFFDFYLDRIPYIVNKKISNKSPEELLNNYCCSLIEYFDDEPEDYSNYSFKELYKVFNYIKTRTKDQLLIKQINCLLDGDRYIYPHDKKVFIFNFIFNNNQSEEEIYNNFDEALNLIEKYRKDDDFIIPTLKGDEPTLQSFELQEKIINRLKNYNQVYLYTNYNNENCPYFSKENKNFYYYNCINNHNDYKEPARLKLNNIFNVAKLDASTADNNLLINKLNKKTNINFEFPYEASKNVFKYYCNCKNLKKCNMFSYYENSMELTYDLLNKKLYKCFYCLNSSTEIKLENWRNNIYPNFVCYNCNYNIVSDFFPYYSVEFHFGNEISEEEQYNRFDNALTFFEKTKMDCKVFPILFDKEIKSDIIKEKILKRIKNCERVSIYIENYDENSFFIKNKNKNFIFYKIINIEEISQNTEYRKILYINSKEEILKIREKLDKNENAKEGLIVNFYQNISPELAIFAYDTIPEVLNSTACNYSPFDKSLHISYYAVPNKISRCNKSKFLEDISMWRTQFQKGCSICRKCFYRNINYCEVNSQIFKRS